MKLLIELPTWLGDCAMATPSIENICNSFDNCEIVFIGSSVTIELMRNHPNCIKTIKHKKNFKGFLNIVFLLGKFDIFISYRSSIRSTLLKFFVRSTKKFQYKKKLFTVGHQVEKYNNFINNSLELNKTPGRLRIYKSISIKEISKKPILGINPGASYGYAKCWPAEYYVKLITELSNIFDIYIFGGNDEKIIGSKIEVNAKQKGVHNIKNYCGKTSIDDLCSLFSSLDLLITGDSGPMHIAAALELPTISIFGPTRDHETSQWKNSDSVILKKNLPCQPCMKRVCPLQHHSCMRDITPDEVVSAVKKNFDKVDIKLLS